MDRTSGAPDRLILPASALRGIEAELEAAYPREACGVLLGDARDGERVARGWEPAPNRWPEREDRYRIDPDLLARLLAEEERGGPSVLGFYHSHPDAPPQPSETDRRLAWPWYDYLIIEVRAGRARQRRVWRLDGDGARFVEGEVQTREDGAGGSSPA